ncbi:MAG: efflux RND transporter periplasmic adaptor subunit [Cyanobacteria bacterium M_surface_10_m2_179]|nr:efflux RND transporter periplasmic adaptor subunit [Cyanobacteria bacterium M_surface_10_m2_179]
MAEYCGAAMRSGLMLALGSGLLSSCSAPAARPPARVQAQPLQAEAFERSLNTVSSLEATSEVELASQAGGRVQRLLVQAGTPVVAGQMLVVLDQTQLRADVAALQATAESDALSYQRYKGLVAQGAATALQRDELRAKAIGSREALRAKQADLAYKDVRAPISGVIGDISIKPGDVLQAGTPFSRIIRNAQLQARIDIPANQANAVAKGQRVQLLDGVSPRPLAEGRISQIDPGVSSATQTLLAKATINNSQGLLRNGQRLRTRVLLGAERQLAVPFGAVTRRFGQSFVFVVGTQEQLARDPGKADLGSLRRLPKGTLVALQQPVKLGALQGDRYPVIAGLTPSDRVILSGTLGLRHGSPIRLSR